MEQLQEQFTNIYQTYSLDQGTLKLAQELTNKSNLGALNEKSVIIIPRMAMWLASKQQQITAVDGSLVHGSGIELNSILNDCQNRGINNVEEVLDIGLGMLNELKIDQSLIKVLQSFKLNLQILNMFYKKLDQNLCQLNLGEQHNLIKSICWSLFLIIKKQVNVNDVVQNTCVLVSVLSIVFQQLIPIYPLKYLNNNSEQSILQYLILQFKIKDLELFNTSNQQCKLLYNELFKQNIIKQLKTNYGITLFVASIINSNQYKLDQYYKQLLKSQELDERIIIPDRSKNMTPKKMTPNIKSINIKQQQMQQKYENHREPQQQQNKYQKLLNYEVEQRINLTTNLREIRLPKNILMSPYAQSQIIATPMTEAMEMYNWVHDKQVPFKKYIKQGKLSLEYITKQDPNTFPQMSQNKNLCFIDRNFDEMIEYCEQSAIIDQNQSKRNLYWTLYVLMLEKQNPLNIEENLLKALLSFIIECVNYILNKSSSILEQLMLKCQVCYFQVWKQIDYFLNNFDSKMPYQLKEHYLDLETKFISYHIWCSDSSSELIAFLNDIQITRQQQNNSDMNRLFKRVLHYCAYQIQTIASNLNITEQNAEYIWVTTKYLISEKTEQLRNHSLDQIVLACFYAVLKITGNQCKFQNIINAYEQTNTWFTKQFIKKIVCNVHINNDTMGDIVQYYNQSFIPQVKQFILQMSQQIRNNPIIQSPYNNKNPALQNKLILDSPLRDVLPRHQTQQYGQMTPSTQLLYAYQESPLLKQTTPRIPIPQQKENISTNLNYGNETQEFIMKKFEQLKTSKQSSKPTIQKGSFSILQQGTPKIMNSSRNSSFMLNNQSQQQQQNVSSHSQTEGNSAFCKLLNFEQ